MLTLLVGGLVAPSPAVAQLSLVTSPSSSAFLQLERQRDQEARLALERTLPMTQRLAVDWGGWFDWYNFTFDDGIRNRVQWSYDLRLWAAFSADTGTHEGYARMRLGFINWKEGTSYENNDNDTIGPNLERGWYQLDVTQALQRYGNVTLPFGLKTKIGRDLVNAGSGYVLSLPLDHVQVQSELAGFQTTFLVGRTPGSTPNIDRSLPVRNETDRVFWMIEERYKGNPSHEPFVYAIFQDDRTNENPVDLLQNYRYDSQYYGWGSTGELVRNLRYNTEWVIQRGSSYGDRRFLYTNDIKAWAFDQELSYLFSHRMQPRISAEYMFASGDQDRLGSPTDARGGNTRDFVDKSFVGFGFRDTGLSLAPRLSNIHIWRVGGSFLPAPDVHFLRNLELGANVFIFAKHRSAAAISDPLAVDASGYLGWETDYYMNYRITSDLSLTVRFGTFFPGEAFRESDVRPFLLTGLTWSF